jgi:hypothetical protein
MATMKLESSGANGTLSGPPALAVQAQATVQNQNNVVAGLGSILTVRTEIDDVLADMKAFHRAEPDMVMAAVSAHGARLVEIIVQCQRVEVLRREWKPVREEADKVLAELKSQFSIASRLIAVRQMDVDMLRGQV